MPDIVDFTQNLVLVDGFRNSSDPFDRMGLNDALNDELFENNIPDGLRIENLLETIGVLRERVDILMHGTAPMDSSVYLMGQLEKEMRGVLSSYSHVYDASTIAVKGLFLAGVQFKDDDNYTVDGSNASLTPSELLYKKLVDMGEPMNFRRVIEKVVPHGRILKHGRTGYVPNFLRSYEFLETLGFVDITIRRGIVEYIGDQRAPGSPVTEDIVLGVPRIEMAQRLYEIAHR